MGLTEKNQTLVTEEMVEKYYHLGKRAKEIEKEMARLKKAFHQYFDLKFGENQKGELSFAKFTLQRHIRVTERFKEEEAVSKLEEMNLAECIKVVKRVDEEKVQAAATLGLIDEHLLEGWKEKKLNSMIVVKEN